MICITYEQAGQFVLYLFAIIGAATVFYTLLALALRSSGDEENGDDDNEL